MSHRDRDLHRVSELREARERAVNEASSGSIEKLLEVPADDDRSRTYVVKLLDVTQGVGKVAGRRLLASLGVDEGSRVRDLDAPTRARIVDGIRLLTTPTATGGR